METEIELVKDQFMEHLYSNEEERYMFENNDCEIDNLELHPEYEHLNRDDLRRCAAGKTYRPI